MFTIPNFITAGSGREMLNIIERLDRSVFEPYVCVLRRGGAIEGELEANGITLIEEPFCVSVRPWGSLILRLVNSVQALRPYRFSLWHSFHWSSDWTEPIIARACGAKWIYTKKSMNWDRKAWRVRSHLANRIVVRNSTLIDSHFSGRRLSQRSIFVPGGVDTARFLPATEEQRGRARRDLGISANRTLVACVAQLVRLKGQIDLVRAARSVPDVEVLLVGRDVDKDYAREVEEEIVRSGLADRVRWIGGVTDVRAVLHASDIFVLPTTRHGGHEEGSPVAVLEAMACALPVLASDVAGSRDLVADDETGFLFPPSDAEALAHRLSDLVASEFLRNRLGSAGRMRVENRFSVERETEDFVQLYLDLLR